MGGPTSLRTLAASALVLCARARADAGEDTSAVELRRHNRTLGALRDLYDHSAPCQLHPASKPTPMPLARSGQAHTRAASGPNWVVPPEARWFPANASAFDHLAHCSWSGVVCCFADAAVDAAVESGALLSAGRVGWRHFAQLGADPRPAHQQHADPNEGRQVRGQTNALCGSYAHTSVPQP